MMTIIMTMMLMLVALVMQHKIRTSGSGCMANMILYKLGIKCGLAVVSDAMSFAGHTFRKRYDILGITFFWQKLPGTLNPVQIKCGSQTPVVVHYSQTVRHKAAGEWQAPLGTSQVPGSQRNADRAMQRFCPTAGGSP